MSDRRYARGSLRGTVRYRTLGGGRRPVLKEVTDVVRQATLLFK